MPCTRDAAADRCACGKTAESLRRPPQQVRIVAASSLTAVYSSRRIITHYTHPGVIVTTTYTLFCGRREEPPMLKHDSGKASEGNASVVEKSLWIFLVRRSCFLCFDKTDGQSSSRQHTRAGRPLLVTTAPADTVLRRTVHRPMWCVVTSRF